MKPKLKIFSASYPFGLTETFLHNEIHYLAKYFDIEIYPLMKKSGDVEPQKLPANISYFNPFLPRSYFKRVCLGLFNLSPILPYLRDLVHLLLKTNPSKDLIKRWFLYMITYRAVFSNVRFKQAMRETNLVYFYWGNFPVSLIRLKSKVFVRVHGGEVNFERYNGYIPLIRQKIIPTQVTYLPISIDAMRRIKRIEKNATCVLSRLGVDYHGLNPSVTLQSFTPIVVVSCSNIIGLKRLHLIVDALACLRETHVQWIHFGDGPLFQEIKNRAKKLTSNIRVDFRGRVANKEVFEFYSKNSIDLFINVSETEGVPVSIMEALSFGIPCFATDVGGTSEILDSSGGKLVPIDFPITELTRFIADVREVSEREDLRSGAHKLWEKRCKAEENFEELRKVLCRSSSGTKVV